MEGAGWLPGIATRFHPRKGFEAIKAMQMSGDSMYRSECSA